MEARRPESATEEYEYRMHARSSPHPLPSAPSSQAREEPCCLRGPEFRDRQPSVGLELEEARKSRPCSVRCLSFIWDPWVHLASEAGPAGHGPTKAGTAPPTAFPSLNYSSSS